MLTKESIGARDLGGLDEKEGFGSRGFIGLNI